MKDFWDVLMIFEGLNVSDVTSMVSVLISIGALLFSFYVFYRENKNTQRINAINLEADIYKKIFFDSILFRIPEQRAKIKCIKKRIVAVDPLRKELTELRKRCDFFRYKNQEFHKCLIKKLWDLEDYVVLLPNESNVEQDQFKEKEIEMDKKIKNIYDVIMRAYNGE